MVMAELPLKKPEYEFTYGDYYKWDDDKRWELIDGVAYDMTPAPLRIHQKVHMNLINEFFTYLKDKECEVYGAPSTSACPKATKPMITCQPSFSRIYSLSAINQN